MPETNRDEDGRPFCTEVHSGARVQVALSPDADQAMVSFDYRSGEPINILIAGRVPTPGRDDPVRRARGSRPDPQGAAAVVPFGGGIAGVGGAEGSG
jgi:hypothetical protein